MKDKNSSAVHESTSNQERMAIAMPLNKDKPSKTKNDTHGMDAFRAGVRMDMMKDQVIPPDEALLRTVVHARAFDEYVRTGKTENALKENGGSSGGYLVPDVMERTIMSLLEEENVMRRICLVKPAQENTDIPVVLETGHAVWVDENGTISDSDTQFGRITIHAHKLVTAENISNELLDDSAFDMESFITKTLALRLVNAEEAAFVDGDGNGKPLGLLRQAEVGVTTEDTGRISADDMIDLIYSVPTQFRKGGALLMHPSTLASLYKIKTASDRNIWGCDLKDGFPLTFLGYPILFSNAMPTIASGSKPLIFGDFKQFRIADRGGHRVKRLNEILAQYDQTRFQITERVDAVLLRNDAIRTLLVA